MIGLTSIAIANFSISKRTGIFNNYMPNVFLFISAYLTWILCISSYHFFVGNDVSFFNNLKDTMKAILGFLFVLSCGTFLNNKKDLFKVLNFILLGQIISILTALACMFFLRSPMALREFQTFFITAEGFQGTIFRNPNMYSRYLYLSFPILFASLPLFTGIKKNLLYFCLFVGAVTIFTSVSRMAIVMVITVFVLAGYLYGKKFIAVTAIFVMVVSLIIMGGVTDKLKERFSRLESIENQKRIIMLLTSLSLIKEHPITGTGAGSFNKLMENTGLFGDDLSKGKAAHNNFLFLAVQFGLPSAILFSLIMFLIFYNFWKRRKTRISGPFSIAGFITFFVFLGAGMSSAVFGLDHFWFLLGVLYVLQHRSSKLGFWNQSPLDTLATQNNFFAQYSKQFTI
ncbi:MAG: O-antigen ligase family protein [Desulfobacterales bacterium]|nr:O-antigen ligase family protein [Desulfobacterales bacterium]